MTEVRSGAFSRPSGTSYQKDDTPKLGSVAATSVAQGLATAVMAVCVGRVLPPTLNDVAGARRVRFPPSASGWRTCS
jgi:hypothetical protein